MKRSLGTRVHREKLAYDEGDVFEESAKLHQRYGHVFQCKNTVMAEKYYEDLIKGSARGSVVLDYGCFNGWMTPKFLSYSPERLVGIDISERGIAEAKEKYASVADFRVMDAHDLKFENASFDLVVGRAILHHLDFNVALQEINRILKPGGKAIFLEPLRDNPVGKLLRALTPKARTSDELPLSRKQIVGADKLFGGQKHHYFGLVSVPIGIISSFVSQNPQNIFLNAAHHMDVVIGKTTLKYWMRYVVLCWEKEKGNR